MIEKGIIAIHLVLLISKTIVGVGAVPQHIQHGCSGDAVETQDIICSNEWRIDVYMVCVLRRERADDQPAADGDGWL